MPDENKPSREAKDYLAIGMAITLRMFQIQSNNTFFDRLKKLDHADVYKPIVSLKKPSTLEERNLTIMQKAMRAKEIPDYQLHFKNAIDAFCSFIPEPDAAILIERGAIDGYKIINLLWNSIYPKSAPQESN